MIGTFLTPRLPVRFVQDPVRQVDGVAAVMPQQVVDPRARLPVHVQIGPAEEVGLDDHVVQVERAFLDALPNLAVRRGEPPGMRDHQRLARPFRRVEHLLRVGQVERHRDLDLHVLALGEGHQRLRAVLVAGSRQDHRVDAGPVDARLQVVRGKGNLVGCRELRRTLLGPGCDRDHFDAVDFGQRLGVNLAHRTRACQTNLHQSSGFTRTLKRLLS
jgi:hypothetical protein